MIDEERVETASFCHLSDHPRPIMYGQPGCGGTEDDAGYRVLGNFADVDAEQCSRPWRDCSSTGFVAGEFRTIDEQHTAATPRQLSRGRPLAVVVALSVTTAVLSAFLDKRQPGWLA